MAQQKKGWITRILEGKEKSEEYARSTLPTNRWQLFWDIFKGNFGKMVKANLLTLLFFVPLLVVIVFGSLYAESIGITYPFGANLGVGYPATPNTQGLSEYLTLQGDLILSLGLILGGIIAAVGLSGGMYVMRNMVWTEGVFVSNDFWRGVKLNFKNALQTVLFFTVVFSVSKFVVDLAEFSLASGGHSQFQKVVLIIAQGLSYGFIVFGAMMSFWMIALGVNYKIGFFVMVKNAAIMSVGTLFQTLFFGALALLPFFLFLISWQFIVVLAVFICILFGFSWALLLWLDFAQWVFDKYVNPKIEGAKVGRGIYNRTPASELTGDDSAAAVEYQRLLLSHGKSNLVAKPIKPIDDSLQLYDLPNSFNREDLKRLRESKENIAEDTANYAEEHKNDLRYVEYNRQFDEREKALKAEDEKRNGGKKLKAKKAPKETDENAEE